MTLKWTHGNSWLNGDFELGMKVLILIRKWYDSRLKYSFMTILWLVLDSKFALRKYFDYSHTLSDFSLNINFSIWLQLTLKPSWFIKVYNVWLFLTIADYFWLFLTFMRKFLTQNLSLAEVIFWILGGWNPLPRRKYACRNQRAAPMAAEQATHDPVRQSASQC